ncbi:hypothetical protein AAMO2058_000388200 [Amorphochlora amoebiformis]
MKSGEQKSDLEYALRRMLQSSLRNYNSLFAEVLNIRHEILANEAQIRMISSRVVRTEETNRVLLECFRLMLGGSTSREGIQNRLDQLAMKEDASRTVAEDSADALNFTSSLTNQNHGTLEDIAGAWTDLTPEVLTVREINQTKVNASEGWGYPLRDLVDNLLGRVEILRANARDRLWKKTIEGVALTNEISSLLDEKVHRMAMARILPISEKTSRIRSMQVINPFASLPPEKRRRMVFQNLQVASLSDQRFHCQLCGMRLMDNTSYWFHVLKHNFSGSGQSMNQKQQMEVQQSAETPERRHPPLSFTGLPGT